MGSWGILKRHKTNHMSKPYRLDVTRWSVERIMFAIAGLIVVVFATLSLFVDDRFVFGCIFIGTMLVLFALTGYCPMAMLVDRQMQSRNGGASMR